MGLETSLKRMSWTTEFVSVLFMGIDPEKKRSWIIWLSKLDESNYICIAKWHVPSNI